MDVHRLFFFLLISAFACLRLTLSAQPQYTYQKPSKQDDGWPTDHLATKGIDTTALKQFFRSMYSEKKHGIHSILLIKDRHLVLEEYFADYDASKTHDIRSATKSITSLLVGIALDKGFINSLDDPISMYLDHYRPVKNPDERKQEITIRHLLTMSAGWECNDWDKKSAGQEDKMYKKKDWVAFVLDLPMQNNPGDTSLYCTGGVVVLGEILKQATGMKVDAFAKKYLFQLLGITHYQWSYFGKDKQVDTGGHLYLTPRDMAKIGQLVLDKGKWEGKSIVSAEWIDQMTDTYTNIGNVNYGFLWWTIPFKVQGKEIKSMCATGNGGQFIMVIPSFNLVGVFTGENYNSPKAQISFHIMNNVILPAQKASASD